MELRVGRVVFGASVLPPRRVREGRLAELEEIRRLFEKHNLLRSGEYRWRREQLSR